MSDEIQHYLKDAELKRRTQYEVPQVSIDLLNVSCYKD